MKLARTENQLRRERFKSKPRSMLGKQRENHGAALLKEVHKISVYMRLRSDMSAGVRRLYLERPRDPKELVRVKQGE